MSESQLGVSFAMTGGLGGVGRAVVDRLSVVGHVVVTHRRHDTRAAAAVLARDALFIRLMIFITADMDHPYAGSISVDPGAFDRLLEQVIDQP